MSLSIVHYNDPILRKKGNKVTQFGADLAAFGKAMIEAMNEAQGIGLAAQQVGQSKQICVVDLRESEAEYSWELDGAKPPRDIFMPLIVVNPQITLVPGTPETVYEEGCLSFPEIRGDVTRPDEIKVEFQDEYGMKHVLRCNGLLARCFLHEVDHLNGVLFIDRMDKATRTAIDGPVKALAKETRDNARPKE
ncbi:MAG TPA: peptide deformylase [Opitutaceae bacterium]|jgi:peptide deformylase